ncbi:Protein of unknown function [Gryllus bimaculatus]|nr:Protein of unknown function [Gryllus bimaculatus]
MPLGVTGSCVLRERRKSVTLLDLEWGVYSQCLVMLEATYRQRGRPVGQRWGTEGWAWSDKEVWGVRKGGERKNEIRGGGGKGGVGVKSMRERAERKNEGRELDVEEGVDKLHVGRRVFKRHDAGLHHMPTPNIGFSKAQL